MLSVALHCVERGIGRIGEVLLSCGDDTEEPGLAECCFAVCARGELVGGVGEEDANRLLSRLAVEGTSEVASPKFKTKSADLRCRDGVCDSGDFNVEGSDGEVGRLRASRYEGLQRVRRSIVLSADISTVVSGQYDIPEKVFAICLCSLNLAVG